jgi:ferritin-like metal-binding protein YciE
MGFAYASLQDVFADQLNDLRSAEEQLVQALPTLASAANSEELRHAFEEHLAQTREHFERVEDLLATSGVVRTGEVCVGMRGVIEEGSKAVEASGDPMAKDAALIAAAQRAEHYEIAAYGTAATLADQLGLDEAHDVLGQTLDEEETADKLLTKIATGGMLRAGVNQRARR